MARPLRNAIRLPVTLVLAAIAAAVAGCATAPSGGPPRAAPGGSNQVQSYVQPLPPPGPTSKWTPAQVVLGFLHASASYAFDPAAARQYLVPELRKNWHPGRAVAVVGAPTLTPLPYNAKENLGSGQAVPQQRLVHLTGPQVATLSQSGQYEYAPGNVNIKFLLAQNTNGVWLIEQLPQQTLMLTESDFEEVYQPRNLFFFARAPRSETPSVLVPDPVYAPLQSLNSALNTDLATGLVNGLLKGQGGWLSGATISEFPRGTRLLKKVTIAGKTAQVDLGGAAASLQPQRVMLMADQLAATLGDGSYATPLATHVQLSINNSVQFSVGASDLVTSVPAGPIDLITGTNSIGQLASQPVHGAKPQARPDQPPIGSAAVTALATSPDSDHPEQLAVAIQKDGGCAVDEQPGGQGAYKPYTLTSSGGPCTSLSYDASGNLWAATGLGVWLLAPGQPPVQADLSALTAAIRPGDRILALRMAPDAVRAALLVSTPAGNQVLLAAVDTSGGSAQFGQPVTIGTSGLTDPLAISWYDAYHLAVLAAEGIYEVPLTGGAGQQPALQLLSTAPPGATTLTTDGAELVVGTSQGVYAAAASSPGWSFVTNGADPVYPG